MVTLELLPVDEQFRGGDEVLSQVTPGGLDVLHDILLQLVPRFVGVPATLRLVKRSLTAIRIPLSGSSAGEGVLHHP